MNDRQIRTYEAYERITLRFADRPLPPETELVVQRLRSTLEAIKACETTQHLARHSMAVTTARYELECMRRDQLLPLARLCLRAFAGEPALKAALRVPHKRAPTKTLLAAAAHIAKTLRPLRAALEASGVDPRRVTELHKKTRQLEKQFRSAYGSIADRAVPTRRLRELFSSALLDVGILDAFVGVGGSGPAVAAFKSTRKIGKRMGRPKAKRRRKSSPAQAA